MFDRQGAITADGVKENVYERAMISTQPFVNPDWTHSLCPMVVYWLEVL